MFLFQVGLFAHPIYSISGDYPAEVRARVDNNSRAEGYQNSRLPFFTQEEVNYIRGQRSVCNTDGFSVFGICLVLRRNLGGRREGGQVPVQYILYLRIVFFSGLKLKYKRPILPAPLLMLLTKLCPLLCQSRLLYKDRTILNVAFGATGLGGRLWMFGSRAVRFG